MKHSNVVWWGGEEDYLPWNWGDQLNPWLFSKISGVPYDDVKKVYLEEKEDIPRYYCIGSILNHVESEGAEVWGSGFEYAHLGINIKPTKIHAVRGPLTRKGLIEKGIDCPEIYGDPALLMPKYYTPKVKKKYKYGIIQHFLHQNETAWLSKYENDPRVNIIDITNPSITGFVDEINKCEMIFSSALHGIICADAYGIPSYHVNFDREGKYNWFKFNDYYASVGRPIVSPALLLSKDIDIEEIWPPPYNYYIDIDLDKLYEACPFKK